MSDDAAVAAVELPPEDVELLLDRAVAGVPRRRRAGVRRELAGYVEDAFEEMLSQGLDVMQARRQLGARFGSPDAISAAFHALPPPRWVRQLRGAAGPLGVGVLGLVLGLALLQVTSPREAANDLHLEAVVSSDAQTARRYVREVNTLVAPLGSIAPGAVQVTSRLGVPRAAAPVLEPSVPALTPTWLPDGYIPERGALFLTASATVQYFSDTRSGRAGIVVEALRPDRSMVFQVKERHVFQVALDGMPGFYIDGEWEVRGPEDEAPAPATWRTDRSHSLLFARDGLLVLVAGPADVLDMDGLVRVARSLR